MKNRDVFTCPSKPEFKPRNFFPGAVPSGEFARGAGGYGINPNLTTFNGTWFAEPRSGLPIAQIPDSAGTFLVAEGAEMGTNGTPTGNQSPETWGRFESQPSDWNITPPSGYTGNLTTGLPWSYYYDTADTSNNNMWRPALRHQGGLTVVYCDGHAKWSKIEQFLGVTPARPQGWPYGDRNNSWDNR